MQATAYFCTRHEPMLRDILESWTRDKSVAEIVAILDDHAVPAAPIWDVEQAASSAQTAFRQLLVDGEHPVAGSIRMMEQPVHYSGVERGKLERSPLLGEHTNAVLSEWLNADATRIELLRQNKVIA